MDFIRQLDIFNPKEYRDEIIAIIGCGAIGSVTGLLLAKLGFRNFVLFDHDKIEPHNLPNQFYMMGQLNEPKAAALKKMMYMFSDDITSVQTKGKLTKTTLLPYDIVITAMDNMKYRKLAFETAQNLSSIFIDARMGGQVFRLYTINLKDPANIKFYESTLYADNKASEEKCTERSIIFNTMGIASFIGKNLTAALTGKPYYKEVIMDYYNMELMKR